MDEILGATRSLYDRQAREYVTTTGDYALFPGLKDEVDRFYGRAIADRPLLDLGCGVGRDTEYLLSRGSAVVAADLSIEMLRVTSQRCLPADPKLVQLSMTHLPFKGGIFGGAWVCASLLHVPMKHLAGTLNEIRRVLVPGGTVAISMKPGEGEGWHSGSSLTAPRWFTFVSPEKFEMLLQAAGFESVRSTASGRRNWFITEAERPTRENPTATDCS